MTLFELLVKITLLIFELMLVFFSYLTLPPPKPNRRKAYKALLKGKKIRTEPFIKLNPSYQMPVSLLLFGAAILIHLIVQNI
ncbi:hypothetical protein EXD82_07930 [Peptacetobacter hominis]|uniref:DUF3899 domain-containing protein n=1 Tax=Peptacetobacter hominis TaxID=2743610 RepID=A0A544QU10_9FIRM|nr:hypothetical protein [Peptacetobacter hominis]TQQ84189.1 hypothetical protein EXD82_07930 [Peptacetobacter hominis]